MPVFTVRVMFLNQFRQVYVIEFFFGKFFPFFELSFLHFNNLLPFLEFFVPKLQSDLLVLHLFYELQLSYQVLATLDFFGCDFFSI